MMNVIAASPPLRDKTMDRQKRYDTQRVQKLFTEAKNVNEVRKAIKQAKANELNDDALKGFEALSCMGHKKRMSAAERKRLRKLRKRGSSNASISSSDSVSTACTDQSSPELTPVKATIPLSPQDLLRAEKSKETRKEASLRQQSPRSFKQHKERSRGRTMNRNGGEKPPRSRRNGRDRRYRPRNRKQTKAKPKHKPRPNPRANKGTTALLTSPLRPTDRKVTVRKSSLGMREKIISKPAGLVPPPKPPNQDVVSDTAVRAMLREAVLEANAPKLERAIGIANDRGMTFEVYIASKRLASLELHAIR